MKTKLYELSKEFEQAWEMLEHLLGENEDQDSQEALFEHLETVDLELEIKSECVAHKIQEKKYEIDVFDQEIKRLQARKKTLQNEMDGAKFYLKQQMEKVGKASIKGRVLNIKIQKNSQPTLIIEDETKIPSTYKIGQISRPLDLIPENMLEETFILINKNMIKDAVSNGEEVSGVRLENGTHLRIR
jgi:hypothetical protein